MISLPPILVTDLFPELQRGLIGVLHTLADEDWHKPTMCSQWTVKDIVAHLLDTNLRRLSLHRDRYASPHFRPESDSAADLTTFLHRANADWTRAAYRISPGVLIHLLEWSGQQLAEFLASLDPFAPAFFPVAWAGEAESLNWFDIAREYTEKWHHGEQILEAVDRPSPLLCPSLYHPVLETFVRALPFTFREVHRPEKTRVRVVVEGDAGGEWNLVRQEKGWHLLPRAAEQPATTVILPQRVAWKVWTKKWEPKEKLQRFPGIVLEGDSELGQRVVGMVSIMA